MFPSLRIFTGNPEYFNFEFGWLFLKKTNYSICDYGICQVPRSIYSKINIGYDGKLVHYRGTLGYSPFSGTLTCQFGTGVDMTKQNINGLLELQLGISILKFKYQVVGFNQHYFFIGIGAN